MSVLSYSSMMVNPLINKLSVESQEFENLSNTINAYGTNHALAEFAARVCYKSTSNLGHSPTFLKNKIVDVNHMDVFEHHFAEVIIDSNTYYDIRESRPFKYVHSSDHIKAGVFSDFELWKLFASDRVLLNLGLNLEKYFPGIYGPASNHSDRKWGRHVDLVDNGPRVILLAYDWNYRRFVWLIENVSIFTATQITRHRVGSFSQQSGRYVSLEKGGWAGMVPPHFTEDQSERLLRLYEDAGQAYQDLKDMGVKNEDARCVFPVGYTTRMVLSFDDFGLNHFLDLRLSKAAQWEIRAIAEAMEYQEEILRMEEQK